MLGNHTSIVIPQGTPYAEEMRRHEAQHTQFGPPGRPYPFKPGDKGFEFPKRVYKAVRAERGIDFEGYTVQNDEEQRNMQSRGWCLTQASALEALEAEQTEHGKLAAERNYEIKHGRVSERAAEEVRAAEAAHGARHLPSVPETPITRRGRKPKTESVPA